jgi:hypothetical protein
MKSQNLFLRLDGLHSKSRVPVHARTQKPCGYFVLLELFLRGARQASCDSEKAAKLPRKIQPDPWFLSLAEISCLRRHHMSVHCTLCYVSPSGPPGQQLMAT